MIDRWLRIEAPHFVATTGLSVGNRVIQAAPILKYMGGWTLEEVRTYCSKKGWTVQLYSGDKPCD